MRSLVVTMKKVDIPSCIAVSTFLLVRIINLINHLIRNGKIDRFLFFLSNDSGLNSGRDLDIFFIFFLSFLFLLFFELDTVKGLYFFCV